MSIFDDNILPGKTGKVFTTDATDKKALEAIAREVLEIDGIHDVGVNTEVFPVEFTIHTNEFSMVPIETVEKAAKCRGFHLIPKYKIF